MPRVGVLLSGCGFLDGAEIQESVLTLLALDQRGATAVCCAPDIDVTQVVDHQTQQPVNETRNVLKESARIARCEIQDVANVQAAELDALILPGGFGAAKNLCSFAADGPECAVNPDVARLVGDMLAQRKPVGAVCIAPVLVARLAGQRGLNAKLTIGNDAGTAGAIRAMGCSHQDCPVGGFALDEQHRLLSTPAYMLAKGPAEVFEGIRRLVDKLLEMAG